MKNILFLRRKGLGLGSLRGLTALMNGMEVIDKNAQTTKRYDGDRASYILNTEMGDDVPDNTVLLRWGCTSKTQFPLDSQYNKSTSIAIGGDKKGFRRLCQIKAPEIIPHSVFDFFPFEGFKFPMVVRSAQHSQGNNLWLVNDEGELRDVVDANKLQNNWYASEYIDKVAEYRVYIVKGRVVRICAKIQPDEKQVAWNQAQGGNTVNVRWDDWNMDAVRVALKAHELSTLDFSGVDVMIGPDGKAYVLEINSAPSLWLKFEGTTPSYSHECFYRGLVWMVDEKPVDEPDMKLRGWRDAIHPAVLKKNKEK